MNKRVIILAAILVLIASTVFSGCKSTKMESSTAYGVAHQQYAAMVNITVTRSGNKFKVKDVKIKEYLPLSEIGKVASISGSESTVHSLHGYTLSQQELDVDFTLNKNIYYANKIKIGDKIFTFSKAENIQGNPYIYKNDEYSDGQVYALYPAESLPNQIKNSFTNQQFTKWYIDRLTNADFFIIKGEGSDTYDIPFTSYNTKTNLNKNEWADKQFNGYWQSGGHGLGWLANIQKMEQAIKTFGLEVYTGTEENSDGYYFLGNNITGVTLVDYHQYMQIAKTAYQNAKLSF